MKFIRRLVRHGNSSHVSIPPQVIDHLRWRAGDGMAVIVTEHGTLEIRRAVAADLQNAQIPPMTMDMAVPGAGR